MPALLVPRESFAWGALRGPAAVVESVRRSCREMDTHDPLDEASSLHLKHHGLDGAQLWLTGNEGFALLRSGQLDLAVAPAARRQSLGTEALEAALTASGPIQAWSHGDHPAAARLAGTHRLDRVRELWVLRRPVSRALPELVAPDDVTLRGYRDSDAEEVLRVNAAAFARHPEQGAMDAANLAERMAEDWFDPEGLIVAVSEGSMVGFHWTKQHSRTVGEVYVLGIDPVAQGRGLGRQLTVAGLGHLEKLGVAQVQLYVEADNLAALRLYTRLGFEHAAADTHAMYSRGW